MVTRVFVFMSGGPTYVSEQDTMADIVAAVNTGILFDLREISGSTIKVNPANVISVLERQDPQ